MQVFLIGTLVFFSVNSINLIFSTAPSFAKEMNVEVDVVANIMTLAGTGEIVFRIIHGWLADRRIFSALTQIYVIMLCCTVATVLCATLHGVVGMCTHYAAILLVLDIGQLYLSFQPLLLYRLLITS